MAHRFTLIRCPEVAGVGSSEPPGLPCLGIDNEYGRVIASGGTTLVSSWAGLVAAACADGQYQAQCKQKADEQATEICVPV
jgi:hypothetical protein